jgi:hypothetical protein
MNAHHWRPSSLRRLMLNRVRKISAGLVQGRITAAEFRPSHGRGHPG